MWTEATQLYSREPEPFQGLEVSQYLCTIDSLIVAKIINLSLPLALPSCHIVAPWRNGLCKASPRGLNSDTPLHYTSKPTPFLASCTERQE